ncbi:unnamed protein product [Schistosoma curassoni]|uniref:Reverse transcriptase domain-containing protein n=1 Tax=Schistosoma curassoni TaxID=6186 RepID=A0A183JSJ7_9TREM|nr:unnamed protein product [Schistosoma curassoni]
MHHYQIWTELQCLEKQGVLSPVSFSAWGVPIVIIKKPNSTLRICADVLRVLSAALVQYHKPVPDSNDIFKMLNGESRFATLTTP